MLLPIRRGAVKAMPPVWFYINGTSLGILFTYIPFNVIKSEKFSSSNIERVDGEDEPIGLSGIATRRRACFRSMSWHLALIILY